MRQIFVNLPVRDLERSKAFFAKLGFGFDAKFTEDPDGHIWELVHMRSQP